MISALTSTITLLEAKVDIIKFGWLKYLGAFSAWISWGAVVFLFTWGRNVDQNSSYVLHVFWKILLFLTAGQVVTSAAIYFLAGSLSKAGSIAGNSSPAAQPPG
jgi:hypothetical protein